ncbi:298_t:CDS:1, partial [Diversispora eburnea]
MKVTRKKDMRIIHILENYLKEEEQNEDFIKNVDNIEIEDYKMDKENQSPIIKNS